MYLFQQANGLRGIFGGQTFLCNHNFSTDSKRRLYEPSGVSIMKKNFKGHAYNGRYYFAGGHTGNVFVDEWYRLLRLGMMPPIHPPTVTPAAGAVNQICYLSFWDEITGERSSLSSGTTILGAEDRTWTVLPTVIPNEVLQCDGTATIAAGVLSGTYTNFDMMRPGDRIIHSLAPTRPGVIRSIASAVGMTLDDTGLTLGAGTLTYLPVSRATHVELWVSVEGALPRLSGRARIGMTTYHEAVAELLLGEAFLDTFEPFPLCSMNAFYQDRQLLAGDDRHRDTLYLSELFFPERYAGLNFKTRNGDPITGIVGTRDYALIYTYSSTYILQGYTENDLTFRLIAPDCGAFAHTTNCLVGDVPWQFNQRGGYLFNGAHHNQTLDRKTEWQRIYRTYTDSRTLGFSVHNPNDYTIQFWPEQVSATPDTTGELTAAAFNEAWIADYSEQVGDPSGGISQPNWGNDEFYDPFYTDAAYQPTAAAYLVPTDFGIGDMYYGFPDGRVYIEQRDIADFVAEAVVRTPTYDLGSPGGDMQEGKTLRRLWSYVVSEDSAWQIHARGGDEYALEHVWPEGIESRWYVAGLVPLVWYPWKDDVAASFVHGTYGDQAKKVVHVHSGVERVSGRRFVFQFVFTYPVKARFIGLGGVFGPGPAYRGLVTGTQPG